MRRSSRLRKLSKGKIARFVGGPLDGNLIEKTGKGPWAIYRGDDGENIPVHVGDKEFIRQKPPTRFYSRQIEWITQGDRGFPRVVYVHATIWREWLLTNKTM